MKSIGKAMKVGRQTKASESDSLREALKTYRQTPHPATGIPPANMLFRDGIRDKFPRKPSSTEDIEEAREMDQEKKKERERLINSSKYRKSSDIFPGDLVLVRDWARRLKFDPIFLPTPFIVKERNDDIKNVLLKDLFSSRTLLRHLDDVKPCHHLTDTPLMETPTMITQQNTPPEETAKQLIEEEDYEDPSQYYERVPIQREPAIPPEIRENIPQRVSTRIRKARRRYIEIC